MRIMRKSTHYLNYTLIAILTMYRFANILFTVFYLTILVSGNGSLHCQEKTLHRINRLVIIK